MLHMVQLVCHCCHTHMEHRCHWDSVTDRKQCFTINKSSLKSLFVFYICVKLSISFKSLFHLRTYGFCFSLEIKTRVFLPHYPMLLTHLKVIQVSRQLVIIFRHTVLSVVLEVVGQTIIKEHRPLWRKTES